MRALLPLTTLITALAVATASPFLIPITDLQFNATLHARATDLQTFTGALAAVPASPITNSGIPDRPFSVAGNSFPDFASAGQRSCDTQFQGCQAVANSPGGGGGGGGGGGKENEKEKGKGKKQKRQGVTVDMCNTQKDQCNKAQQSAKVQDFTAPAPSQGATVNIGPDPLFPDFDLICDA